MQKNRDSYVQGDKLACKVCNKIIEISMMRLHVAKHILLGEVLEDVCGFCAKICNSSLALKLISGSMVKGTYKAQSSCTFRYPFSMKATIAGSAHNPCTNRSCVK